MIRSRYLSTAVIAAALAAAPAWAQSTGTAKTTTTATKPLCSELHHPQAGKLADKDTGMAKEHSASPVHMDCIPDSQASTTGSMPSNHSTTAGAATLGSTATTHPSATTSPSVSGSSSGRASTATTGDQASTGTTDQSTKQRRGY